MATQFGVQRAREGSAADLAGAANHKFLRGQLLETHRAACVELLGRDSDLGPEPELLTVDETGRRVDQHGGGIDLAGEPIGGDDVVGDDRLGVAGGGLVDMADGLVKIIHDLDTHLHSQELGGKVVVAGDAHVDDRPSPLITHQLDAVEHSGRHGQERLGNIGVHDQRLSGVADTDALRLRIVGDLARHLEIGGRVDIDVAVAGTIDDVGHGGVVEDRLDQRWAASRDQTVDVAPLLHERRGCFTTGVVDHHKGVGRQPRLRQCLSEHGRDGEIGHDGR